MLYDTKYEKRSSERRYFDKPVYLELSVVEKNDPRVIKLTGKGVDISKSGIGLITKYYLKKGSIVRLVVPLEEDGRDFSTFARTVWSKRINGSYRAGLNFLI